MLAQIDFLDETIATLSERIEELTRPFSRELELLDTIPGVDRRAASYCWPTDGPRHDAIRNRRAPRVLGGHVPRPARVRRQAALGQDPQRLQMAAWHPDRVRQGGGAHQRHLPVRPIPPDPAAATPRPRSRPPTRSSPPPTTSSRNASLPPTRRRILLPPRHRNDRTLPPPPHPPARAPRPQVTIEPLPEASVTTNATAPASYSRRLPNPERRRPPRVTFDSGETQRHPRGGCDRRRLCDHVVAAPGRFPLTHVALD